MLNNWGYTYNQYTDIIVYAFPWQEWLRKCSSMLGSTYIACLVLQTSSHRSENAALDTGKSARDAVAPPAL
jgi:hypothetical protein